MVLEGERVQDRAVLLASILSAISEGGLKEYISRQIPHGHIITCLMEKLRKTGNVANHNKGHGGQKFSARMPAHVEEVMDQLVDLPRVPIRLILQPGLLSRSRNWSCLSEPTALTGVGFGAGVKKILLTLVPVRSRILFLLMSRYTITFA